MACEALYSKVFLLAFFPVTNVDYFLIIVKSSSLSTFFRSFVELVSLTFSPAAILRSRSFFLARILRSLSMSFL